MHHYLKSVLRHIIEAKDIEHARRLAKEALKVIEKFIEE